MSIDCSITEAIKADFNTLWNCAQRGDTVEITTPYVMPDSNFLTLYFTERDSRFIACDGGRLLELVRETIDPSNIEALDTLRELAREHQIKEGENDGEPIFFKACSDKKLISSIAFDVANFATMAANVLIALYPEAEQESSEKFVTEARKYIATIATPEHKIHANYALPGIPNIKFSSVLEARSKFSVVSCISGRAFYDFRKNVSDVALNFKEAWKRRGVVLRTTIPVLNDQAAGYDRDKLGDRLEELTEDAKMEPVLWSEKERLRGLLAAE